MVSSSDVHLDGRGPLDETSGGISGGIDIWLSIEIGMSVEIWLPSSMVMEIDASISRYIQVGFKENCRT